MSFRFRFAVLFLFFLVLGCNPFGNPFYKLPETCKISEDCPGLLVCSGGKCLSCAEGQKRDCYEGPAGTEGKGICKKGQETCDGNGVWGGCQEQVLPKSKETCGNKLDDDCNGMTDSEEKACKSCEAGKTEECYSGPENTKGVGICAAGTRACNPDGTWGECKDEVGPATEETCGNNKDDNCDGKTDAEDPKCQSCKPSTEEACYNGPAGTKGVGPCKEGKRTCDSTGKWGNCEGETLPQKSEICNNGKDDNCNGKIDVQEEACQCKNDSDCSGSDFCFLLPGKTQGLCLTPCKADSECKNDTACVPFGPGPATYCLPAVKDGPCDLTKYQACPKDQYCNSNGMCMDAKTGAENASCDGYANRCKAPAVCAFLPLSGVCLTPCSGSCSSGHTCVSLKTPASSDKPGVCLKTCSSNSGCNIGTLGACRTIDLQNTRKYCLPAGTQGAWQNCRVGVSNCKPGLRCLIEDSVYKTRPVGYCLPDVCEPNKCPSPSSALQQGPDYSCLTHPKQGKTCLIPCANNAGRCDKVPGFSCRTFPGVPSYCAP